MKSYLSIGHAGGKVSVWGWHNGRLEIVKGEDFDDLNDFHNDYAKYPDSYTGRIDHNKKMISVSSPTGYSPAMDRTRDMIVSQLVKKFKGYQVWFQDNNGQNPFVQLESIRDLLMKVSEGLSSVKVIPESKKINPVTKITDDPRDNTIIKKKKRKSNKKDDAKFTKLLLDTLNSRR